MISYLEGMRSDDVFKVDFGIHKKGTALFFISFATLLLKNPKLSYHITQVLSDSNFYIVHFHHHVTIKLFCML